MPHQSFQTDQTGLGLYGHHIDKEAMVLLFLKSEKTFLSGLHS